MKPSEREEMINSMIETASYLESLLKQKGWEFVQNYYEAKVKDFATNILTAEELDITKFDKERQQIIGIKKLLGEISSVIENANREREKDTRGVTEGI